jgi:hypothetical protein
MSICLSALIDITQQAEEKGEGSREERKRRWGARSQARPGPTPVLPPNERTPSFASAEWGRSPARRLASGIPSPLPRPTTHALPPATITALDGCVRAAAICGRAAEGCDVRGRELQTWRLWSFLNLSPTFSELTARLHQCIHHPRAYQRTPHKRGKGAVLAHCEWNRTMPLR